MHRGDALRLRLRIAILASALWLQSSAVAATITWTGAELLNETRAAFPNQAPEVVGTSIRFSESGIFAKLIALDLSGLVEQRGDTRFVDVSAQLTRLSCVGICAGASDWDPGLFLTDGSYAFGAAFGDPDGVYGQQSRDLDWRRIENRTAINTSLLFGSALFPMINGPATMRLVFELSPGSSAVSVSAFGQEAEYRSAKPLTPSAPLLLVLVSDNESGERYQLDALTVSVIPEPSTWLLLALGLTLVGLTALRRGRRARARAGGWRPTGKSPAP